MRIGSVWLRAAGVATLLNVGAGLAQGPVAPVLPTTADPPAQFQPANPLAPIGTPVPGNPGPPPITPVSVAPAVAPAPGVAATTPVAPAPTQFVAAPPKADTPLPPTTSTAPAVLNVKQLLPETVVPGQAVSAEVSVTNAGGKAAENVVLAGWWTAGYELAESSVAAQPSANGRQSWNVGVIPAGESRTVKVKLMPKAGTTATEFRSGFDATFSSASDTRAVKVLKPELQVTVEGSETAFSGQSHTLHLKVKNPSAAALEKVAVKVELPDSLAHPKGASLESEIAVLAAGTTEAIPLHLTAVRPGVGRVKVKVTSAGSDALTHDVMVNVIEARVSVSVSGPKQLYQNWPATFEATVENSGDQPIKGATFDVKLPAGLSDLRASDKPGLDAAANRLVWKLDLAPGEKKTVFWFGFAKQSDDLTTTAAVSVSGTPLKRAEQVTKNLGTEK
jgi:hypothetical protein